MEAWEPEFLAETRAVWRSLHRRLGEAALADGGRLAALPPGTEGLDAGFRRLSALVLSARRALDIDRALVQSDEKTDEEREREEAKRKRLADLAEFNAIVREEQERRRAAEAGRHAAQEASALPGPDDEAERRRLADLAEFNARVRPSAEARQAEANIHTAARTSAAPETKSVRSGGRQSGEN